MSNVSSPRFRLPSSAAGDLACVVYDGFLSVSLPVSAPSLALYARFRVSSRCLAMALFLASLASLCLRTEATWADSSSMVMLRGCYFGNSVFFFFFFDFLCVSVPLLLESRPSDSVDFFK